jgi:hypothetical protein
MQVTFRIQTPLLQKEGDRTEQDVSIDYKNGDNFTGNLANGLRTGEGTYTFSTGDMYAGEFQDGNFFGKGTYTTEGGDIYEGTFLDNRLHGQGVATYMSIPAFQTYTGFWQNNLAHGKGKLTLDMGDYYEGAFENGRYHGRGVMYYTNGDAYDGSYVNGYPQGDGEFIFKDTNVIMRRKFAANGVDRANTSDLRANTFDIKKKNNVKVKEFKQPQGKQLFHPKAPKKVDNSALVQGLLGGLKKKTPKSSSIRAKSCSKQVKKGTGITKRIKKVTKLKPAHSTKSKPQVRKIAPTGRKTTVKQARRVKSSTPTVWSDYAYKYPNAQQKDPVETSKIIAEIEEFKPELRRSKSILFCLQSAKAYFEQRQRLRNSSNNTN